MDATIANPAMVRVLIQMSPAGALYRIALSTMLPAIRAARLSPTQALWTV
jgi:ABC-type lipoprotein release transport system permease subunit